MSLHCPTDSRTIRRRIIGLAFLSILFYPHGVSAADFCWGGSGSSKQFVTISQTTSTQLITGRPNTRTYICSFFYNGADAENLSLVEGTGSVCATNTFALVGATTAANGNNFTAGSGVAQGNGAGTVAFGSTDANAAG